MHVMHRTVLAGTFYKGQMVTAQLAQVVKK
jgi:hypothetical protein